MEQPNPVIVVLQKIWPTIYKIVNSTIYFVLNFIKNFVKMAIEQIKGGL